MNEYLHTAIALASLYIAYKIGAKMRAKAEIEKYTAFLEEQGFVHIEQMKDGSYEFIKHWKFHQSEQSDESI